MTEEGGILGAMDEPRRPRVRRVPRPERRPLEPFMARHNPETDASEYEFTASTIQQAHRRAHCSLRDLQVFGSGFTKDRHTEPVLMSDAERQGRPTRLQYVLSIPRGVVPIKGERMKVVPVLTLREVLAEPP